VDDLATFTARLRTLRECGAQFDAARSAAFPPYRNGDRPKEQ
jgi:hypothetical protein